MSVKSILILTASILSLQTAFAVDMSSDNKACNRIAIRCLESGYTRNAADGKDFWKDCMKPLLLNKSVTGVNLDASDVKECRTAKIKELKAELEDLRNVK